MTMTMDSHHQQRYASFGTLPHYAPAHSHFANPNTWATSTEPPTYAASPAIDMSKQPSPRTTSAATSLPLASYAPVSVAGPPPPPTSLPSLYGQSSLVSPPQDLLSMSRLQATTAAYGEPTYATAPMASSPVHATYPQTSAPYDSLGYPSSTVRSTYGGLAPEMDQSRRYSQSSVASSSLDSIPSSAADLSRQPSSVNIGYPRNSIHSDDRRSFAEALDASQGLLGMSQETPRNIYGPGGSAHRPGARGSVDSYGFPATHSTSSSISSTGNFGSYYSGVDSVSDYSTAGSDIESVASRSLHSSRNPSAVSMVGAPPPPAQSMMGQFSSKVASSTQKKHKCKVCDKRFTRPSSLQTHMYSHTGEKPFACEVEGCGRHFSVVSNLRRHRKVHKGEAMSETSEDHDHDHSD